MSIRLEDYDPIKGNGKAWVGFDLDGTLAVHGEYKGRLHIGEPIPEMIQRVFDILKKGGRVRIVTARVSPPYYLDGYNSEHVRKAIENWCMKHIGVVLPVTCRKDRDMYCLVDDRAIQAVKNTGTLVEND